MSSTLRLTFLYPQLYRVAQLADPLSRAAATRSRRGPRPSAPTAASLPHAAPFTSAATTHQSPYLKRHGKAVEPIPLRPDAPTPPPGDAPPPADQPAKQQPTGDGPAGPEAGTAQGAPADDPSPTPTQRGDRAAPEAPGPEHAAAQQSAAEREHGGGGGGPLDAILHMPAPGEEPGSGADDGASGGASRRPGPPLTPRRYVHHFDSYSLVKQLGGGGFTAGQAITAMKAIRGLLAANLDVAQGGLVSKSDVENETYLFRAACSELSAELRNNRRAADDQMRQQRTLLQHEVDILAQTLSHEALTLNDNVRGMFNDRRMAVREEQKAVESAIQQINYKISTTLSSDTRSGIEGVRWVLIRRSVLGILFMAVLTLGSLRYASYASHERQKKEQERLRQEAEALRHAPPARPNEPGLDGAELAAPQM